MPQIAPVASPAAATAVPPVATAEVARSPSPSAMLPDPPAETRPPPAVAASPPAPAQAVAPRTTQQPPAPPPVAELAESQERFTAAVAQARDRYKTATDPTAKRDVRASRRDAVCQALGSLAVKGWVGTIDRVSSEDGKGMLKISLASGVRLKTWESVLADIGYDTLVDAKSSMFRTASSMREGERVEISGSFVKSELDCAKVANAAQDQAIVEPEYIFRFSSLSRAQ